MKLNSYLLHLTKTNLFGYVSPRQVICTKVKKQKNNFMKETRQFFKTN